MNSPTWQGILLKEALDCGKWGGGAVVNDGKLAQVTIVEPGPGYMLYSKEFYKFAGKSVICSDVSSVAAVSPDHTSPTDLLSG